METSELEKINLQHYQPVNVPESPVSQRQGNLTGSPRIVQDSSADLYNCIQEWNTEHLSGVEIISEICNTKILNFDKHGEKNPFPHGLQSYCNKLDEICHKMEVVLRNIEEVINHIEGVMKLNIIKKDFNPVFTTWKIEEYEALSKQVYGMYRKELQLKLYIKENIGHAVSLENVLLYQTIWVQQPYVDNLDLQIEAMLKETNLRQ